MQSPVDTVVGNFYEVPIVNNVEFGPTAVLLPFHRDGADDCLKDVGLHYHIDWRFELRKRFYNNINALYQSGSSEPYLETRQCLKEFTCIDFTWPFMLEVLYKKFEDFELGEDRICPHRGTIVANKCGTCPAHGLRWNFKTRKLMHKPPFYFVLPNGNKGRIKDSRCQIEVTLKFQTDSDGMVLPVIDSRGSIYKNATFYIEGPQIYRPGDTISISDKNCGAVLQ